jgi:hypothetical protein
VAATVQTPVSPLLSSNCSDDSEGPNETFACSYEHLEPRHFNRDLSADGAGAGFLLPGTTLLPSKNCPAAYEIPRIRHFVRDVSYETF